MDATAQDRIKKYWEERASNSSGGHSSTTDDVYLREVEISATISMLRERIPPGTTRLLDVGCGDGYSTLRIAQAFSGLTFLGIDYSEGMIRLARQRLESQPEIATRGSFALGDVTNLVQVCGDTTYDLVLSDRCLINLATIERQRDAITQIAQHVRPGALYLAIENFAEGHDNMNAARQSVGLPAIPVRWHNRYFKEKEFIDAAAWFFEDITLLDFSSSYYFATRVIYSAMCQMRSEAPDYHHEIHRLAINLPWVGKFSPVRMAVMRRRRTHGNGTANDELF
jgi:ubiquinone/menaquinone biosynthesis C-methylase UbiE